MSEAANNLFGFDDAPDPVFPQPKGDYDPSMRRVEAATAGGNDHLRDSQPQTDPQPRSTAPFVIGSPTSEAAAQKIAPHLSEREAEVLAIIRAAGDEGLTDNQLIAEVVKRGGSANGPRARRIALEVKGLVVAKIIKGGKRVTCDGSTVWIAKGGEQ